jgi:hypothetical protein
LHGYQEPIYACQSVQPFISSPTSWNAVVNHGGSGDGFAIQWTALSSAQELADGQSLNGLSCC